MTNRLPTYTSQRQRFVDSEDSESLESKSLISKLNDQATSLVRNHAVVSITVGIAIGATLGWLVKRR